MRVGASIQVAAPAEAIWDVIAEPDNYLHFMSGVTRWEVVGKPRAGMGARYRMLLRVGSAEVGGLIEIVESSAPADMAWVSVVGIDQRGRWRLRERPEGTRVELRLSYGVAGAGLFGWVSERLAAPTVRGHLRKSLAQLKRQVEYEQLRATAAKRRSAGATAV